MNIKTYDKTIKDLLISGRRFVIPRFQREYSWDKKNYVEFYTDIIGNLSISNNTLSPNPYFLGTMLFVGNFTEAGHQDIQIVDGQQRITTITIFFSALSDTFKEHKQSGLSEAIFKYIMTKDDNDEPVRILKTKTSYPFFSFYIQDYGKGNRVLPQSEEEQSIYDAYSFFKEQLEEKCLRRTLSNSVDKKNLIDISYIDILKAIRDQILGCTFVAISTTDDKQANRIFEILNAKGKRLAHIDLIKNRLFEVLDTVEPADFAQVTWEKVKTHCNVAKVGLGTFYRHFWTSTFKKSSTNRLYDDFNRLIKKDTLEYKNFLILMEENAKLYEQILVPKREDYNNKKEYFWLVQTLKVLTEDFNVTQVRVALMSILQTKKRGLLNMSLFKSTLKYIEDFHFAYTAIMSGKANKLDSIYSKFSIELRKCKTKDEVRTTIHSLLIDKLDPLFPSYAMFKDQFVKLTFSKQLSPANLKCRYALRKLNSLYSGTELYDDSESVEHIMPESLEGNVLNIGNLILLEVDINNQAGDKSYIEKIPFYQNSKYKWVKLFVDSHQEWNLDNISTRAEKLAEKYYTEIFKRRIE